MSSRIYSKTTDHLKTDLSFYLFVSDFSDNTYSQNFMKMKMKWLRGRKIYEYLNQDEKDYLRKYYIKW